MAVSAIPPHDTLAWARWRALYRSAAITAATASGLYGALLLALLELPPEWGRTNDRVTVLTIGGTTQTLSASMVGLGLDDQTMVQGAEATFGRGGAAALSWIVRRTRDNPILSVEPPRDRPGETEVWNTILSPNGRECRVVVFLREDRIDVSECLSPDVGRR